jgi:membrane protein implicated in regulation of membrane protease activity
VNVLPSSTLICSLVKAIPLSTFSVSPSLFWFGGGVVLCLIELFFPKTWGKSYKLVPLIMGVSSLIVAFFVWRDYNFLQDLRLQIAYWMALSTACVIWVRPMLIKGKKFTVPDATEARTLTEILLGETGQVLYEGCIWQARTEGYQGAIASNQRVYVVRREGNILIVLPENLFQR